MGAVDSFAVDLEACTELQQRLFLHFGDCAVRHGADVQQHVAVFADNVHQREQHGLGAHHILLGLLLVIAEGVADTARQLKLLFLDIILKSN